MFCPNDLGHPSLWKGDGRSKILSDAYIAIKDGKILAVGTGQPDPELIDDHTEVKPVKEKVATPGLIGAIPTWSMEAVVSMNLLKS